MIIVRSPLRVTLGGGGTDLPSYYRQFGGFLVAAAIDKYVYVTIHNSFVEELIVKYSSLERVASADQLKHPLFRECLGLMRKNGKYLEIASFADIPAGTGLGSSGSFGTALLRALHHLDKIPITAAQLSELACKVEIDILKEPSGKQDQYISAFGGVACFEFNRDDTVNVASLQCSQDTLHDLEDNLMLFFTGYTRDAASILKEQDAQSQKQDSCMIENLHHTKELGVRSHAALQRGDMQEFGRIMNEHWRHKRKRSQNMSNTKIDVWYDAGLKNGAIGGKLVGAGGGGFLMFIAENRARLRSAMTELGLSEVRFRFDYEGAKIVAS